jgi:hypothetical protein
MNTSAANPISKLISSIRNVIFLSIIYFAVTFLMNRSIDWPVFTCVVAIFLILSLYPRFGAQGSFLRDVMPFLVSLGIAELGTKLLSSGSGEEFTWISCIQFVSILVAVNLPILIWKSRTSIT